MVIPKVLDMSLQLKTLKEEVGKIKEGINLNLDLNSTKLSRGSSLLFIATLEIVKEVTHVDVKCTQVMRKVHNPSHE